MKRLIYLVALIVCVSLTACGSSEKASALSSQYDFYTSSINGLKTATGLSGDEADSIFEILAAECGVDSYFIVTKNEKGGFYNVNYKFKTLKMYLDGSTVASVFDGENQIYPATAAAAQTEEAEEAVATEVPEESAEVVPDVPHRTGKEIVGISDKNIADISLNFAGDVRNDVTGNWRYATTSENIDFEEYALSYYKEHFAADNEIHAIINFTRKTTARMNCAGDMIFLSFFDYVDGEEHDAKQLFSGTPLADFIIYIDNGDIEKVVEE